MYTAYILQTRKFCAYTLQTADHHPHSIFTIKVAHSLETVWRTTHLHASSPLPILAVNDAQDSEKGQVPSLGRPQRSPALQKNTNILTDVEQWTFSFITLTLPNVG